MVNKNMRCLLLLIMLFFSNFAFASDGIFSTEIPENDIVAEQQKMITGVDLHQVFGKVPEVTILSTSIKIFAGLIMSVASFATVYVLIVGTMQTANDGVVLGKKWGTAFVPLRILLGILLIMPIPTYSVSQLIFIKLNAIGLQGAIYLERVLIDTLQLNSTYNNPASNRESLQPILNAQIKLNVCNIMSETDFNKAKIQGDSSYLAKLFSYATTEKTPAFTSSKTITQLANGEKINNWEYGDKNSTFNKDGCGTLKFRGINPTDDSINSNDYVLAESIRPKLNDIKNAFTNEHIKNIDEMNQSALAIASKIINKEYTSPDDFTNDYKRALDTYSDNLNNLAKEKYGEYVNADSLNGFTDQGIFSLGALFNSFAVVQGSIQEYRDKRTLITIAYNNNSDSANNAVEGANQYIQYAGSKINPLIAPRQTTMESQGDGVVDKIVSTVIDNMPNLAPFMNAQKLNRNPMSNSIDMGLTVQHSYGVAAGVSLVASTAGKAASGVPFLGGVGTATAYIAEKVLFILNIIIVPSFLMANVVPLLPVMIWFWVLLGCNLFMIKGLIGVQMWGMTHVIPDGDNFVGRQGQGYMNFVIALTQYPLSVIGFFSGYVLMIVGAMILNGLFGLMALNKTGGITGLINYIVLFSVYAVTYTVMIKECLSLAYVLPDELFSWLGKTSQNFSRHDGAEQSILGAGAGIGTLASSATSFGSLTPRGGNGSGQGSNQKKKKDDESRLKIRFPKSR